MNVFIDNGIEKYELEVNENWNQDEFEKAIIKKIGLDFLDGDEIEVPDLHSISNEETIDINIILKTIELNETLTCDYPQRVESIFLSEEFDKSEEPYHIDMSVFTNLKELEIWTMWWSEEDGEEFPINMNKVSDYLEKLTFVDINRISGSLLHLKNLKSVYLKSHHCEIDLKNWVVSELEELQKRGVNIYVEHNEERFNQFTKMEDSDCE